MLNWKTAVAGAGVLVLIAAVHHAHAQEQATPAPAVAPHGAPPAEQTADAGYDERHQQLSLLLKMIFADTDMELVKTHLVDIAEAHADEFGMPPESAGAHMAMAVDRLTAVLHEDPDAAAENLAHIILDIQIHAAGP